MIYDPTRTFFYQTNNIENEPTKEPKWYQKIWWSFRRFLDSDFVFYTIIAILRIIQVSLIVLSVYFMSGGKL